MCENKTISQGALVAFGGGERMFLLPRLLPISHFILRVDPADCSSPCLLPFLHPSSPLHASEDIYVKGMYPALPAVPVLGEHRLSVLRIMFTGSTKCLPVSTIA